MAVFKEIGAPAVLEQCAEECSELAQVCLKLARKLRGENPTPAKLEHIQAHLTEEIADVLVCVEELYNAKIISNDEVISIMQHKSSRWTNRIEENKKIK